ncbi:MAG: hypothetical protein NTW82_02135 [Bacteroidia bacterium]|nr:hypothetical protein [Bacteroidia bacterium]
MKKLLLIFSVTLLLSSCVTYYRVATDFYNLRRGMTKQQFISWVQPSFIGENGKPMVGGRPSTTKTFKYGQDVWEVWVFDVYTPVMNNFGGVAACVFDHQEYVAFKNDLVEEWGTGSLPITIRQNPTQFDLNINHN